MVKKSKRVRTTPAKKEGAGTPSKTGKDEQKSCEAQPVRSLRKTARKEKVHNESDDVLKGLRESEAEDNAVDKELKDGSEEEDVVMKESADGADDEVNFAELVGVGEHSDESDEEGAIEVLALSRLPGKVVSESRNDEPALEKKLADIAIFASAGGKKDESRFWESLTVTMPLEGTLSDSLALDDLKREQRFAELATAAAHIGLDNLRRQKKKFRRPTDYFAQMVKTDTQMGKVKAKILHHKERIESAEKRRNNRDIAKNKKKVRSSQLQKEQDKKRKAKEEIQAFSRLRKERLKQRAGASATKGDGDVDDDFPIELLNVEQLDDKNTFQSHADISSGKKKAWSGKNDKFNKPKPANGARAGQGNEVQSGKLGTANGIRKPRGGKKRVGRSRRKAGAK